VKGFSVFGKETARRAPGSVQTVKREEARTRAVENEKTMVWGIFQNCTPTFRRVICETRLGVLRGYGPYGAGPTEVLQGELVISFCFAGKNHFDVDNLKH
jgi:hypothetical protein